MQANIQTIFPDLLSEHRSNEIDVVRDFSKIANGPS
jgi:hypothetical protein